MSNIGKHVTKKALVGPFSEVVGFLFRTNRNILKQTFLIISQGLKIEIALEKTETKQQGIWSQ